jgi:hypothetical protein
VTNLPVIRDHLETALCLAVGDEDAACWALTEPLTDLLAEVDFLGAIAFAEAS